MISNPFALITLNGNVFWDPLSVPLTAILYSNNVGLNPCKNSPKPGLLESSHKIAIFLKPSIPLSSIYWNATQFSSLNESYTPSPRIPSN